VELELKLSALPQEDLQPRVVLDLAETLLGLLGEAQQLHLQAHYHDDEEGLLRSSGWALRARREGTSLVATAKGPEQHLDGVPARPEINEAIDTLPAPGAPLPQALAAALGEAGLPIRHWPGARWITDIQRTFVDLRLAQGGRAELAIDHGCVYSKSLRHPIRELELELRSGLPEELRDAARQLSEHLQVRPGGRTKAARGLQLLGKLQQPQNPGDGDLPGCWRHMSELEEWLREGHHELEGSYLEAARALLQQLGIEEPRHLSGDARGLRRAIDSSEHARLLWRIFCAVHPHQNER
jgi:inorganic triphosphatase YgiF